jgi:hypothetical protein
LEEVIGLQALEVDLRIAVMACLSGQESRRWTVGELVKRLKGLGICATKAGVTAALAGRVAPNLIKDSEPEHSGSGLGERHHPYRHVEGMAVPGGDSGSCSAGK